MKKTEVLQLMAIIRTNYQHFEISEEKAAVWHSLMEDTPFGTAKLNLKTFMQQSPYPPTAADIIRRDPSQFTDYGRLRLETEERLQEVEVWHQQAVPLPERLVPKMLRAGEAGD
ncbi:replicative helicase loader/inhibitor [Paenibacillus sp. D9]|uniref:replicative helicase loader/inhibitor n=1 Tax=Paenibacillus sp. D9 TaxID=665792 RepID=UPI0012EE18B0|nr:replicative helicase loader/inhibitor [Paenibacillus sp. D9]